MRNPGPAILISSPQRRLAVEARARPGPYGREPSGELLLHRRRDRAHPQGQSMAGIMSFSSRSVWKALTQETRAYEGGGSEFKKRRRRNYPAILSLPDLIFTPSGPRLLRAALGVGGASSENKGSS